MTRQRIWIFNAVLFILLVWGGMKLRNDWRAFDMTHQISQIRNVADPIKVKTPTEAIPAATDLAWTEIASRSPFSFDRNDGNLDLTEAVAAPASGPRPVLFGTLILGNERLALLGKAGVGGRSGLPVKVGETFEGWQVVDIQDKGVVVTANGAKESLVVGRAPIDGRSAEKTGASSTPVASSPAASSPSAATPRTANPSVGLGSKVPPPVAPPGSHLVPNPFSPSGFKIELDEK